MNPHFESLASWEAARSRTGYEPLVPRYTAGHRLRGLSLFVRDHRMREVPTGEQSLEAHYDAFVFAQSRPGPDEALRAAREVKYGLFPEDAPVAEHVARTYELGPEPEPDDPDPRMPSVVVWADGPRLLLVASERLTCEVLLEVARSMYR